MPTPGRLEVVVKFSEMPSEVTTDKSGWKHFVLDCGGKLLKVGMRPKNWAKVEKAVADWPQWVAALSGQLQLDVEGLSLPEASVQVFERKSKDTPVEKALERVAEPSGQAGPFPMKTGLLR
jgi:hypothetical protein